MDDTNSRYRDLFFEETDEYLQTLDDSVLALEQNPNDDGILDEIFRAAHTLKGMAATMGYETMTELTHSMENVFELFRSGDLQIDASSITLIFKCLDKLTEIVEDLRAERDVEYDISDLLEELDKLAEGNSEASGDSKADPGEEYDDPINPHTTLEHLTDIDLNIIEEAEEGEYVGYYMGVRVSEDCQLKGARAFLVINNLEKQGEIISTLPDAEKLENGDYDSIFELIILSKISAEELKAVIEGTPEIDEVVVREIREVLKEIREKEEAEEEKEELKSKDSKEASKKKTSGNSKATAASRFNESIRVDLGRLDSIMNLVSELVIYRTRLEDISSQNNVDEIDEPLEHVGKITSELQDLVLKIRMQPVDIVLNRFPRMIRDLSQELDKDIELVIEGEDTELDRTVVSELGEPLVHLIRNAADHGIESREKRLSLGKPAKGTIELNAYQEGNRVIINVGDDGKGLDPEIIKESAERKGIDTEGMTDREIINLIFHQGFSTVKDVTNVSGRGVGMDVVRKKISSLGGDIQVVSEVNVGTNFIIKLPLTLSIIQALMVEVGQDIFAVPLGIIERVMRVEEGQIERSHSTEVYMYREKAVPVIRVNEKLGIESSDKENHIILISLGEEEYGLVVEGLMGQQEIVIKKLGKTLSHMREYLGATILGNGDIVLILDVGNLSKLGDGDIDEL